MTAVSDIQGLDDLSLCAYALGMAFGRQAQDAADVSQKVRCFELFERCFHGFRVAVALKLRLTRGAPLGMGCAEPAKPAKPVGSSDAAERLETIERPDSRHGLRVEREGAGTVRLDQDRDRESVSLPLLLKTLGGVVAVAETLPGPRPAELPTLRELLARMAAKQPAPSDAPKGAPKGASLGTTTAVVSVLARSKTVAARPAAGNGRTQRLLAGAAPLGLPLTPASGARQGGTGPPLAEPLTPKPPWLR